MLNWFRKPREQVVKQPRPDGSFWASLSATTDDAVITEKTDGTQPGDVVFTDYSEQELVVHIGKLHDEMTRRGYQPKLKHLALDKWFITYVRITTEEVYP